jgi:hypothetical protein
MKRLIDVMLFYGISPSMLVLIVGLTGVLLFRYL